MGVPELVQRYPKLPNPTNLEGSRCPQGNKLITHQDKCDTLRNELYQPPPQLEEDHTPDLTNPHEDDLP